MKLNGKVLRKWLDRITGTGKLLGRCTFKWLRKTLPAKIPIGNKQKSGGGAKHSADCPTPA